MVCHKVAVQIVKPKIVLIGRACISGIDPHRHSAHVKECCDIDRPKEIGSPQFWRDALVVGIAAIKGEEGRSERRRRAATVQVDA